MVPTPEQTKVLVQRCEYFSESRWPGGYPRSLALCIIDAVQSTGVRYKSVENVLDAYRRYRREQQGDPQTDGVRELLVTFNELSGPAGWARKIGNQNRTSSHQGAPLKAEAIRDCAVVLQEAAINSTEDLRTAAGDTYRFGEVKAKWLRVAGQRSGVTWRYLLMLAGVPGVKPDRMIIRFVADTLGLPRTSVTTHFAAEALIAAAEELGISPTDLDHGVWNWQRAQR